MAAKAAVRVQNRADLIDHGEKELRALALDLLEEGLAALSPGVGLGRCVAVAGDELTVAGHTYDLSEIDRLVVLGAGKASADLAVGLEQLLGRHLSGGLVVVRHYPDARVGRIRLMAAGHPLPTTASVEAGRALLAEAEGLGERDLAICVFTGGSSALASVPPAGVSAEDKIVLHRLLLAAGMSIVEINTVRKHVSAIKGGRLARAIAPARIVNLTVSDVVGDPLDCITDPTVQDTSTVAEAVAVLEDHDLMEQVPASVRAHLANSAGAESPDVGEIDIESVLVTKGRDGADAVVAAAQERGLTAVRLGGMLEGEASTVGSVLATLARESRLEGSPWPRGTVMVACGGESTVTLGAASRLAFGRGGPSQEAAIAAAMVLADVDGVVACFADTDGSDGGTEVAGGLVDWSTGARARQGRIGLRKVLLGHESKAALEALGDAVVTGLTQTNANDIVVMLTR